MIDWLNLLYNALWILGLAALLANLSLAHWLAGQQKKSLRQSLLRPSFRLTAAASILLFALGLMLAVAPWWYKIGWAGLMTLSVWQGIIAWQDWLGKQSEVNDVQT
jgi:hypothetical protein